LFYCFAPFKVLLPRKQKQKVNKKMQKLHANYTQKIMLFINTLTHKQTLTNHKNITCYYAQVGNIFTLAIYTKGALTHKVFNSRACMAAFMRKILLPF